MPHSEQAADLAAELRHLVNVGAAVDIITTGQPLRGIFTERTTYADGTPAAWVELDDGPLVVCPIADLRAVPTARPDTVENMVRSHCASGADVTPEWIVESFGVSRPYALKLLQKLRWAGLVAKRSVCEVRVSR